jgi:ActR/RegA family two-component response regulator
MSSSGRKISEPAQAARRPFVVVLDDEQLLRDAIVRHLTPRGFQALGVGTYDSALATLEQWPVTAIVADLRLRGDMRDGLHLLEEVGARWPAVCRILVTGFPADVADACERLGVTMLDKSDVFGALVGELRRCTGCG